MPVRRIPKSHCTVTGLIARGADQEMAGYASGIEGACQKLILFNRNVAGYDEQPVTIIYSDKGKMRRYTPDILVNYEPHLVDRKQWRPLLAKVKWRTNLFKKWVKIKPKLRAGMRYANEQGYDFVVLTEREIITPYLKNAVFLLEFRKFPTNEDDSATLLEALKTTGDTDPETLIGSVAQTASKRAALLPTLWQLMSNFRIAADIEQPLNMRTRISLPTPMEDPNDERFHGNRTGRARRLRWRALRYHAHFEP